jgi:hypothetical protein
VRGDRHRERKREREREREVCIPGFAQHTDTRRRRSTTG